MTDPNAGQRMLDLIRDLYPICRSITGEGFRESLRRIGERIPLELSEVPTGTQVFDWTVPKEWNIRDAYVQNAAGKRVIDFADSNLHVVSYSTPVRATMGLDELRSHLHTLPDRPDWIPYRTSYYEESWGFCLAHRSLETLPDGPYEVCIDSTLEPGRLTYGEHVVPGRVDDEVLISCHCCHPSMCNDNLSGMAVAVSLAEAVAESTPHHTYRFLFIPGTIGSITWLARNEAAAARISAGLVLTGLGDPGAVSYKASRRGDALVDRAARHVFAHHPRAGALLDFDPYGYDERQFCSPGFDLPVGRLMRSPNGTYPEYHTSADNLDFVRADALEDSLWTAQRILDVVDRDAVFESLNPNGEPQLGRRGLYRGLGSRAHLPDYELAMLWVLNQSSGVASLLDIAERAGMPFQTVAGAASDLVDANLLARVDVPSQA